MMNCGVFTHSQFAIRNSHLLLVREAELLDLQHPHATGSGGVELHRRRADLLPSRGEFGAELHERGDASLVACRPRLHAAADPRFLLRKFFRLAFPVHGFVREKLGLPLHERLVIAFPAGELTAVEIEDLRRDAAEEPAVVRDDDDGHFALPADHPLEPVDILDVEVVRRLVEEEEVGLGEKGLFETGAADLSAGEGGRRVEVGLLHALPHIDDLQPGCPHDLARVRLERTGNDLQES